MSDFEAGVMMEATPKPRETPIRVSHPSTKIGTSHADNLLFHSPLLLANSYPVLCARDSTIALATTATGL